MVLWHHEDDEHPDTFYQMQRKMTVFGFGRRGLNKSLATPQQVSIGLIESTSHAAIGRALEKWQQPK